MKTTPSPSEFEIFLKELDVSNNKKITLIASKIQDLKLEQEMLIEKIETENTNDTFDMVQLAKKILLIRYLQKKLNEFNENNLEG